MDKITHEQFIADVYRAADNKNPQLRRGQAIFIYIDEHWNGLGRQVMDKVDCFYQDKYIDEFVSACWEVLQKQQES